MYDKAVNRKNNIHFSPRQTLEFLGNNLFKADITYDLKKRIVRQYLDVGIPSLSITVAELTLCFGSERAHLYVRLINLTETGIEFKFSEQFLA